MYTLELAQNQMLTFVLVDAAGTEVVGLGNAFSVEVSKAGGPFGVGTGAKSEVGSGFYAYLLPATECDVVGPLSVRVTAVGCIQQNLVYTVESEAVSGVDYTYSLVSSVDATPIQGAKVWVSLNSGGTQVIWIGMTDTFGVARDLNGQLPRFDPGTYYFFRQKAGWIFTDPDVEIVS